MIPIFPYEILKLIALSGWRAYKLLAFADKRLWNLLRNVDKRAIFSRWLDWHDSETNKRNYYICYRPYKCNFYSAMHVYKGNTHTAYQYGVATDDKLCYIYHIHRYINKDVRVGESYDEVVSMANDRVFNIKHELYINGIKQISETWQITTGVHMVTNYATNEWLTNVDTRNVAPGELPRWVLTQPVFIWGVHKM